MASNLLIVGFCCFLFIIFVISSITFFFRIKNKKSKICKECGKKVSGKDKVCSNCGVVVKRTGALIFNIILVILMLLSFIGFIGVIFYKNVYTKYNDAVYLFNERQYDEAEELFQETKWYKHSKSYLVLFDCLDLLEDDKYQEALDKINTINEEIDGVYSLKKYASLGINYNNKDYDAIYEDYKYISNYFNDKEKEMVQESLYLYGTNKYKEGYYNSAKQALEKIKDYKDVGTILNDKYFSLIGNHYLYSVASGFNIGMVSILFYSYGDKLSYTVYTQSIFNTNIPSGYDYQYRIIDNKIVMGDYSIVYDIVSFDGNILKIRQGSTVFTLEKQ